jgi:hypothetical protein
MEVALPIAVRMEVALRVVFLGVKVSDVMRLGEWGRGGGRRGYSREALPKTVETPRMRIAGW